MPDKTLAVDVRCLDCGDEVLRTEASPGDTIILPDHECAISNPTTRRGAKQ